MSNQLTKFTIGFAGMSHLGIVSAAVMAAKGFAVIGYDADSKNIAGLQRGQTSIEEPELNELLKNYRHNLLFTDHVEKLAQCDVLYISLDVITDEFNHSNLKPLRHLIEMVTPSISNHMAVVVLSQVPPGFTRNLGLFKLQLYYQVETLILGQAVHRAMHPERLIIGCDDPRRPLAKSLETVLKSFHCPILPMRYESAELAKIAINLFLAATITTTNVLATTAAEVGADWHEIVPTLKLDKRIGPHAYLQPGLGIAGGNIERDLAAVLNLSDPLNAETAVLQAWCLHSDYQKAWVYRCLRQHVLPHIPKAQIAILGLAYKANTHSLKNAVSLQLLPKLKSFAVKVHDPVVKELPDMSITVMPEIHDAVLDADVVVILTPWPQYAALTTDWLKQRMRSYYIIDPFQVLNYAELIDARFKVFTLGKKIPQLLSEAAYA